MSVTGIPASAAPGSTFCVTVTGAVGPLKAHGTGSVTVTSTTQTGTRPNTWTVCVTVSQGLGTIHLEAGDENRVVGVRAR